MSGDGFFNSRIQRTEKTTFRFFNVSNDESNARWLSMGGKIEAKALWVLNDKKEKMLRAQDTWQ